MVGEECSPRAPAPAPLTDWRRVLPQFADIRALQALAGGMGPPVAYPDAPPEHRLDAYWLHPEESTSPGWDGQGSGHDFMGTIWHPSSGNTGNCDGGRSHNFCDYKSN